MLQEFHQVYFLLFHLLDLCVLLLRLLWILFLWRKGDINTIDRYGPEGLSKLVKIISDKAVHFQSGYLYHYAFAMLGGLVIILTWFIFY